MEDKRKVHFNEEDETVFNTSNHALTPVLSHVLPVYKNPEERTANSVAPPSTISRPNYEGNIQLSTVAKNNDFLS